MKKFLCIVLIFTSYFTGAFAEEITLFGCMGALMFLYWKTRPSLKMLIMH